MKCKSLALKTYNFTESLIFPMSLFLSFSFDAFPGPARSVHPQCVISLDFTSANMGWDREIGGGGRMERLVGEGGGKGGLGCCVCLCWRCSCSNLLFLTWVWLWWKIIIIIGWRENESARESGDLLNSRSVNLSHSRCFDEKPAFILSLSLSLSRSLITQFFSEFQPMNF